VQAVQFCKTSRFSFTASQKGLLNSSATGIILGIVPPLFHQLMLWKKTGCCGGEANLRFVSLTQAPRVK
jgi:hypothetical protein